MENTTLIQDVPGWIIAAFGFRFGWEAAETIRNFVSKKKD